ncbi:hypothetical protein LTR36_009746 [Oleoguttula mirabilis]|uniref:Uncharacterized protein n=1 Tax=Oleoguttula mirabilis TaxID=1507867 RepID=A0AAV9J5N3_9PEZI|nr:hypothetical protein LTR36_009746 [Oleoguttula mirabilis]
MSAMNDQTTERTIILVGAVLFAGFIAYSFWTSTQATAPTPSRDSSHAGTGHGASSHKKPNHHTPNGDPQKWSEEDMKKFLTSRNLAVGHNPTRNELLAMVESKLHEPTL